MELEVGLGVRVQAVSHLSFDRISVDEELLCSCCGSTRIHVVIAAR